MEFVLCASVPSIHLTWTLVLPPASSTSFCPYAAPPAPTLVPRLATSNTFQNLRFSSALAVATVVPSGEIAECKMRASCACGMSATLVRPG